MKKYKTWEAFKMLSEKPELDLKFKTVNPSGTVFILSVGGFGYYNVTNIDGAAKGASDNLHINNQEWELVKQPVSFIEAIRAYNNGKTIFCKADYCPTRSMFTYKATNKNKYNADGYALQTVEDLPITTMEILEGKWYIQEDEE